MISLGRYIGPNPAVIGRIIEGEAMLVLSEQGQFDLLSSYPPSQETDMDSLGPDDFAQLPVVG